MNMFVCLIKIFCLANIVFYTTALMTYCYFRRESERRNHSLARHADILAAVETRLSLLNMTFMKYVDSNLCCFIPGKVTSAAYPESWAALCKLSLTNVKTLFCGVRNITSLNKFLLVAILSFSVQL